MRWMAMVVVAAWTGMGCSSQVSQARLAVADDKGMVSRGDALNVMPEAICKKLASCNQLGANQKYATLDDCKAMERTKWGEIWSEEKCGGSHGAIAGKVRECEQRASNWGCGGNLFDFGSLVTQCSASDVCK